MASRSVTGVINCSTQRLRKRSRPHHPLHRRRITSSIPNRATMAVACRRQHRTLMPIPKLLPKILPKPRKRPPFLRAAFCPVRWLLYHWMIRSFSASEPIRTCVCKRCQIISRATSCRARFDSLLGSLWRDVAATTCRERCWLAVDPGFSARGM